MTDRSPKHKEMAETANTSDVAKSRLQESAKVTQDELKELAAIISPDDEKALSVVGLFLDNACWANLNKIQAIVEFQGFNPKKMACELLERVEMYDKTKHQLKDMTVDGVTCPYTEKDTTLDIYFMIMIFLVRGNSAPKILATIPSEIRGIITRKMSALGISVAKTDKKLTTTSVTLARISQTFPQVTGTLINEKRIEGKLQPKWLLGSKLPLLMQHSIFSASIPKNIHATEEEIAVALNLEMTVMLQVPKEKRMMEARDIGELEELSKKYVNAAINGTICTEAVQTKVLRTGGVINAAGHLEAESVIIVAACRRFLSKKEMSYKDAVKQMIGSPSRQTMPGTELHESDGNINIPNV